jgi:hypothetical protein
MTKKSLTFEEAFYTIEHSKFKRIAESIKLLWGDPHLDSYLASLLFVTDRDQREGFPPDIFAALLKLYNIHTNMLLET